MSRSFFPGTVYKLLISGKGIIAREYGRTVQFRFFEGPLLDNLLWGLILGINYHGDIFLVNALLAPNSFRWLLLGRWWLRTL